MISAMRKKVFLTSIATCSFKNWGVGKKGTGKKTDLNFWRSNGSAGKCRKSAEIHVTLSSPPAIGQDEVANK